MQRDREKGTPAGREARPQRHATWVRRGLLAGLLLVALVFALQGCFTPPAIMPAGWPELDTADYPPGTQRVELQVLDDRTLVGVFVSAGDDAPVVVVFPGAVESATLGSWHDLRLGSGAPDADNPEPANLLSRTRMGDGTVTWSGPGAQGLLLHGILGWPGIALERTVRAGGVGVALMSELSGRDLPVSWRLVDGLADWGISTLLVDYGGVGASTGERTPDLMAADACAIWDEALRRVAGDPRRVVLRGTSLGCLAVACLLESGAQPAGVVLVAPVRGETVVGNYARWTGRPWYERLALPFIASVTDADVVQQIDRYEGPLLVAVPEADALLPPDERDLLRDAASRVSASWLVHEKGHETLAISAHSLLPGEGAFCARSFTDVRPADLRLDEALALPGASTTPLSRPGSTERARLAELLDAHRTMPPAVAAALALDTDDIARAGGLWSWLRCVPPGRLRELDLPAARALLDLDDSDGAFDPTCARTLAALLSGCDAGRFGELAAASERGVHQFIEASENLIDLSASFRAAKGADLEFRADFESRGIRVRGPVDLAAYLVGQTESIEVSINTTSAPVGPTGLAPEVARRRAARRLLFGLGVPNRVAEDGTLEAWRDGSWSAVDLR